MQFYPEEKEEGWDVCYGSTPHGDGRQQQTVKRWTSLTAAGRASSMQPVDFVARRASAFWFVVWRQSTARVVGLLSALDDWLCTARSLFSINCRYNDL